MPANPCEQGIINEEMRKLVEEKLRELGDTETAVVDTLTAYGYTGETECELTCPAARWLESMLSTDDDGNYLYAFMVGCDKVTICEEPRPRVFRAVGTVELPEPVRKFVANFDAGEYPDLES